MKYFLAVLQIEIEHDYSITTSQYALLHVLYSLSSAAIAVPLGWIADRYGKMYDSLSLYWGNSRILLVLYGIYIATFTLHLVSGYTRSYLCLAVVCALSGYMP